MQVNKDEGYFLVELYNQQVADEVAQILQHSKCHFFLGKLVKIAPVLLLNR